MFIAPSATCDAAGLELIKSNAALAKRTYLPSALTTGASESPLAIGDGGEFGARCETSPIVPAKPCQLSRKKAINARVILILKMHIIVTGPSVFVAMRMTVRF